MHKVNSTKQQNTHVQKKGSSIGNKYIDYINGQIFFLKPLQGTLSVNSA